MHPVEQGAARPPAARTCAQVLVFLGLPTGVLLLGASAIWERAGLLESGLSLVAARPARYAVAVFMGFLVNLSTAFAIKVTGSLTFKVHYMARADRALPPLQCLDMQGFPPCCSGGLCLARMMACQCRLMRAPGSAWTPWLHVTGAR